MVIGVRAGIGEGVRVGGGGVAVGSSVGVGVTVGVGDGLAVQAARRRIDRGKRNKYWQMYLFRIDNEPVG